LGSWSKHTETGPQSIGIGLCRFVGTAPGIFGFATFGLGAELFPNRRFTAGFLKAQTKFDQYYTDINDMMLITACCAQGKP
jgi:hypothetical protein